MVKPCVSWLPSFHTETTPENLQVLWSNAQMSIVLDACSVVPALGEAAKALLLPAKTRIAATADTAANSPLRCERRMIGPPTVFIIRIGLTEKQCFDTDAIRILSR